RLAGNLAASGGDIQIDANGHLSMVQAAAGAAVKVKVASLDAQGPVYAGSTLDMQSRGDLNNQKSLAARDSISLSAGGQLSNSGIIEAGVNADNSRNAGGDLTVNAQTLNNNGNSLVASRNLTVTTAQALNNQGGTLSAKQSANIRAGTLDNQNKGRVLSSGSLNLNANQLLNNQGGLVSSNGELVANLAGLGNAGAEISSLARVTLNVASLDNVAGLIAAGSALNINASGVFNNQGGRLSAQQDLQLVAASLNNSQQGSIISQGALGLTTQGALDNHQAGRIQSTGNALISSASLNNQGGKLAARDISLQVADLDNRQGQVIGDGSLTLNSQGAINNATGSMTSGQLLNVQGASLDNTQGTLLSSAGLTAKIAGQLLNQAGLLSANALLTLDSASLDNQLKGRIVSKAGANLNTLGVLDNRGGSVSAGGALALNANRVDNRQGGSLSAAQGVNLGIDNLDNQGGNVSSQGYLKLTGTTLNNSHDGKLLANGDIDLTLGQLDNQLNGQLSGQAGVQVKAAQLNNGQGGNLYAKGKLELDLSGQLLNARGTLKGDGAILLKAGSLNNDAGQLSSVKGLQLTSLGTLSNLGGSLTSGDTLDLVSGQLNNGAAGSISSAKALTASVSGLDQQGGKLFSSTGLSLDLNNGQLNNQDGLINATGLLLLKNLKGVSNQDGEISSDQGFTLAAQTLDNIDGTIGSEQALVLRVERTLNNHRGLVSANGLKVHAASIDNTEGTMGSDSDLSLSVEEALTNLNGTLSSAGLSSLKAASLNNTEGQLTGDLGLSIDLSGALNNQGGMLGSGKALTLNAGSLDNRAEGVLLAVDGSLTGTVVGAFDNRELGKVRAAGGIELTTGSLDNRGGSLSGKDRLTLRSDLADNRGGLIQADKDLKLLVGQLDNRDKGVLSGKAAIDYEGSRLDNSGGLLSAVGPVTLKAQDVTNTKGRIASQADLTATLDTLNQQGGSLVAKGSLLLTGKALDNRNGGLVGSTNALTLNVDQVDNRAGEISSTENSLSYTGLRLDNSDGGKLLSATDLQLTVAQLINQSKGRLFAKGSAGLTGTRLDNSSGSFSGLKGLDIRLDGALLNNAGLLSSEAGLTLKVATLDNTKGKVGSAGALSVTSLGALLNQGGSVLADQGLTLASSSLDNSQSGVINGKGATHVTTGLLNNSQGGHLTSDDTLDLSATQVDNGASGRIASEKALTANITGLDQQGGELFSKTQLNLDLNNGRLDNRKGLINGPVLVLNNLKDVANQNGEISSAQAFMLAAQDLDNSAGKLLSKQGLTLRIAQALNNQNGLISATSLNSRSASLDNSHGLISSRGEVDLGVTQAFTNQSGTLIGDGAVLLAANSLDNRDGSVAGKADVTATINTLDNQNGQFIASGALGLTGAVLDNRQSGLVGATKALKLEVGSIDNRGGELSSSADIGLTGKRLDNSDSGQIIAAMGLTMTLDQVLNRNQGLINGKSGLTLDGQTLDNTAGQLRSGQDVRLGLGGDLTNNQGLISSEGKLDVTSANLSNTAGSLSSAGVLKVKASAALGNQGGQLVSDSSIELSSASLDNRQQGVISSKGSMGVTTGAFDNSQNGRLNSGDSLTLAAGQVTNRDGGVIGSTKALTASVTGLDQMGGKLFSNTSLTLDLNQGQLNNQTGLINAPSLVLRNLKGIDNQGGEISSAQAFSLTADSLDNSNGKLLSNQALTLRVNQALTNLKGQIAAAALDVRADSLDNAEGSVSSRSDLNLTVAGLLSNQNKGLINATQNLTLGSADLNNQGGTLLGGGVVTLNAMALNNSANGLINSQGSLALTASNLNSSSGGEVSAKGDITLNLGALTQNGGRLLGDSGVRLDLANADLDNRNGLLIAKGPLSISRLRDLNNQNGEISSSLSTNLVGRVLNNNGGKLISNNQLGLTGETLLNQGGLISGWQGLTVNGGSLDNRNNGTLSSRSGDLNANISGALLNSSAGALVSQKTLNVNAASLDNSAGILSSGAGQQLTVGGLLNNTQGGSIDSGAALTMQAMTLNNAGTISAQQALGFTGTTLDNTGGSLVSNGAVNLDLLGSLSNTNGKLASGGPLVISRSSQINNQGGQLVSQGLMSVLTGGLDNRNRGTVAANGNLLTQVSGAVQNNGDGLIYSQNGTLQLSAASLGNAKGTLQSQGAMDLAVTGDIDNQSGRLLAQNGDLKVSATNLDNRGGTLASLKGALEARIVGVLKNGYDLNNNRQGGIAQAQRLNLSVLGGIDNYGGRISAQNGDALITTANFDNRNGGLYAKGLVKVSGNNFDNSGDNDGQIAGNRIDLSLNGHLNNRMGIIESDSTLSVRAASLDNQTGQLRALGAGGKTDFQIGGLFDNRNGKLESANSDLTLNAASFQNQGGSLLHVGNGTFDISTANVTNAGGSLVTRGGLTLAADSWTNSSVIQAGRLTINVNNLIQTGSGQLLASTSLVGNGGNWINDGLIASDGTASLTLGGSYSGNGRYSSLGSLGLTAASMNLGSAGSVASGGEATINVGGLLNNYGRMTSASGMSVNAGSINNFGTLGSNGNMRLGASSLLNQNGLIFSGGDMALRINDFTNRYADVYGMGNISIGRDDNHGWSSSIANISATIESGGDLELAADHVENRKDVFEVTGGGLVSGAIGVRCYTCSSFGDLSNTQSPGYLVWMENYESQIVQDSASASLTAGRNFTGNGRELLNNASTISAGNDLSLNLQNFTNQGAAVGNYSVRRSLDAPGTGPKDLRRWREIMNYNAANDPSYGSSPYAYRDGRFVSPSLNVWNSEGVESLTRVRGHGGGESTPYIAFGSIWVESAGGSFSFMPPSYNNGVRTEAPDFVKNATFFENTITYNGPSSYANAVVQAGGAVRINATQNLTNSVIREGVAIGVGASKVGSTQLAGQVTPTIVQINGQLPPNLAQQQVNPLTLPGFNLPSGQNGLFRLSGQGGSAQQATQANIGSQSWTMGSASVSSAQRQQNLPDIQARSFLIDDAAQVISSDRQLGRITRQVTDSNVSASALNVNVPVDNDGNSLLLPGHDSSSSAITQVGVVHVDGASQSAVATGPDLSLPTLPVNQRDPLASVTSPVVATPVATQTVAQVQGLPDISFKTNPQKYLIETNPVLTELKQFMSSDYLLANLGYDPDESQKRLGDGFYEQKLIQQAVVARTGQRFIDGQTSDDKLFKYLMDNAITSKQQLGLSMGVTLTSQQVAALTHDIVWLEEHEVNGEKVLVPVLYLAQATNRLAPNGALIQGADIQLIAGQDLENAGTLRATNNLSAMAGNNIVNSGLVEAGNRLDLLAGNNIVNKAGGIISGRDVTLKADAGDIINERTVTTVLSGRGSLSERKDHADSAARIEAANDLSLKAGRDVTNTAGELQSGRDLSIVAGRDVNVVSVALTDSYAVGKNFVNERITQVGSAVNAGRDLSVSAGRDVTAISSQIDAKRNIGIAATENLALSSAADEDHTYRRSKKVTTQNDHINQVSTTVNAGGDIALSAGKDLGLIASRISGAGDVDLDAGQDVFIASALDEDYSFYKKKKSGSFGRSSTRQTESYSTTNVASVIEAGNDLTVNVSQDAKGGVSIDGGRDVMIVGSQLKAGNDLLMGATGDVSIVSGVEEHGSYSKKTKSGLFGLSKSGNSRLITTQSQISSELRAGNDAIIAAGSNVQLNASNLISGNDAELHAGLLDESGDVDLASASNSAYSRSESYKKKMDLSFSGSSDGIGVTVATGKQGGHEVRSSSGIGAQVIAGGDATFDATRDINVVGSTVTAQQTTTLHAGRDINIAAGINSNQSASWQSRKDSGLSLTWDRNGFTGFVGNANVADSSRLGNESAVASSVSGSTVHVDASRDISVQGSDVYADSNIGLKAGRDIRIDAAAENSSQTTTHSVTTDGITGTLNHNYGNTLDALKGAGQGEDGVSKISSVLSAADSLGRFLFGSTMDGSIGNAGQSESITRTAVSNRSSILDAGNDVTMVAGNDVTVRGSTLQAGRDIDVKGRDVTFDVAKGAAGTESKQNQSKGGIVGGTTGGIKVGVGGSSGIATQDGTQGTSGASELYAGRNINIDASNDLSLIATEAQADQDIALKAGNDLIVRAAQNGSTSQDNRHSGGGEVGLAAGSGGIGVYASVNIGRGTLDREAVQQQEAYLYAGNRLGFESGRDTVVAGGILRGDEVVGKVGRDLLISSVPDTGKVSGKEFDVSATVTVGFGGSVSGSLGYGRTTGETNWVGSQTSISAKDRLDIRTEQHAQLDAAVLSSDSGNLKLDTGTLGFSDIAGKDKEHGYYLNVGGSYGWGGSSTQDSSQVGKGEPGKNGWSMQGYNYTKDREQIVRATVGAGEITVRNDAATGADSTTGLNRDLSKASEVTKDEEHRTDLYVTKSSTDAISHPVETVKAWRNAAENYDQIVKARVSEVTFFADALQNQIQAQRLSVDQVPALARQALGDERALAIGKNLARAGVDPSQLESIPQEMAQQLNAWADVAAGFAAGASGCEVAGGCSPDNLGTANGGQPSSGTVTLDPTRITASPAAIAVLLDQTLQLKTYIDGLPVEQAKLGLLAAQAIMGPSKAVVSLAASVATQAYFGDKLNELKEQAAIALTAGLTGAEKVEVQQEHDAAKAAYAAQNHSLYQLNGDPQVLASEFLLGIVSDGGLSLGSKTAGRAINVVGVKNSRLKVEPVYKTNKEAKQAAEELGFVKISETVHGGQAVFKLGKRYITRDLDGHNGGAWKMADSVKALGSKETRLGTFDVNLNRIGD
ncbi:hemagglutinin repeat-containing protein, partial [Pseudomonas chlororaphis]|uniref:hemagglutinin repeat-containing protein n=1 Tax=Pseudomonas chlororaphis TaxID=587753 RepID=UPI00406C5B57